MSENNNQNQNQNGGITNEPFKIIQPYNLAVIMTLLSPMIITVIILSISFVFQNFKGLIYLLWLILLVCCRNFIFEMAGISNIVTESSICDSIKYSNYGNSTFSMFFIAFSLVYFCTPMVLNNEANYWVIGGFMFYLILDIWIRFYIKCIKNNDISFVILNLVLGIFSGIIATTIMYSTNTQKYLFFNEASKNKEVCSMPKQQTFHCSVYKNGELIG